MFPVHLHPFQCSTFAQPLGYPETTRGRPRALELDKWGKSTRSPVDFAASCTSSEFPKNWNQCNFPQFYQSKSKRNKVLVEFLNSEKCYHLKPNRTVERSLKKDLKTELRTVDWHSQSKRNGHSSRGKCFQHLRSGISG